MSAPKTNIEKQKRRHWAPLAGIALALIFATLLTAWFLGYLAVQGEDRGDTESKLTTTEELRASN
ncbi:hypothetical protein [Pseudoruegeria sp. HB172150]|uniref:hypothetical protein n=1 Tax=Pseudoruegeria sp. HB172150 TaxID=2721164 RepID=UPI001552D6C2|nr:hypothetical protein [Pseudoruegeria sp. HB172150]